MLTDKSPKTTYISLNTEKYRTIYTSPKGINHKGGSKILFGFSRKYYAPDFFLSMARQPIS